MREDKEREEDVDVVLPITQPTETPSILRANSFTNESTPYATEAHNWPKSEIRFIFQLLVLFVVICVSLFCLITERTNAPLWTSLLSGSLGVLSPVPESLSKFKLKRKPL